jgi:hypothetical protein
MPTVKDVASSFLYGLSDDLYSDLKNQLANARHFNMSQPEDLIEAYALASNYQVPRANVAYHQDRTVLATSKSKSRRVCGRPVQT